MTYSWGDAKEGVPSDAFPLALTKTREQTPETEKLLVPKG